MGRARVRNNLFVATNKLFLTDEPSPQLCEMAKIERRKRYTRRAQRVLVAESGSPQPHSPPACYTLHMINRSPLLSSYGTHALILLILIGVSAYAYTQNKKYIELQTKTDTQVQLLSNTTASLSESIKLIQETLSSNKNFNDALTTTLFAEQGRAATFQQELSRITGTVGTLDKLSRTDKELLQKYSKVYFLNEHYVPSSLSEIDAKYLYSVRTVIKIHTSVLPYLTRMMDDAGMATTTTLYVKSAYRSFYDQVRLKSAYSVTYGAGTANQFSAEQGYSEHQLGTTVDFTTLGINGALIGFDKKPAFEWLKLNAHRYGFVLSYPKNNGYYIYEPWHWRYVGVALATKLQNDGKNFYDTDQRVIDEYLISIF